MECTRCHRNKDPKDMAQFHGAGGTCKMCSREAVERYRLAHPEHARQVTAKWKRLHPEQVRAKKQRRRARLRAVHVEKFTDTEIFERDHWICQICDEPIDRALAWPDPWCVSLDHIQPIARGGTHTRVNTQASHLRCNVSKGAKVDSLL